MRDYLSIGCTPHDEPCVQIGTENCDVRAKKECRALIGQLTRVCGEPPTGAMLKVVGNPHDMGTYYEVHCIFNDASEEAVEYAYKCESELPENWDTEALKELNTELPPEFSDWMAMTRHYNKNIQRSL